MIATNPRSKMTQLIENKPRRHALIATLLRFDDPTRVVVLSDQRESKDLLWLSSPHAPFINRQRVPIRNGRK